MLLERYFKKGGSNRSTLNILSDVDMFLLQMSYHFCAWQKKCYENHVIASPWLNPAFMRYEGMDIERQIDCVSAVYQQHPWLTLVCLFGCWNFTWFCLSNQWTQTFPPYMNQDTIYLQMNQNWFVHFSGIQLSYVLSYIHHLFFTRIWKIIQYRPCFYKKNMYVSYTVLIHPNNSKA